MVNLLMLITSLSGGGAEKVASDISINLSSDIEAQIVTLTGDISYPTNKPPISLGFNFKKFKFLNFIYAILVGTFRYRNILKSLKANVSISFLVLDNIINILSCLGNDRVKSIVSVHIAMSEKLSNIPCGFILKYVITILYNKADLIIAVSDGVRQDLINTFKIDQNKIKTIYNPIDIQKIENEANEPLFHEIFDKGLPIVFSMGRLTKQKGHWHLLRSFKKVKESINCILVIRGTGKLDGYLKKLVIELSLENDVIFLEWIDNPYKYLSKSSVFVFPSLWEALPVSLIEAMVCGVPVIATDCKYGPREILGDSEYGILIPPLSDKFSIASDPLSPEENLLADKIISIISNEGLCQIYSKKGKLRSHLFEKSKIMARYELIIKQLNNLDRHSDDSL